MGVSVDGVFWVENLVGWCSISNLRRRQGKFVLLVCLDAWLEIGGDYSDGLLRRACSRFLGVSVGGDFRVEFLVGCGRFGFARGRQGKCFLRVCLDAGLSRRRGSWATGALTSVF